MNGSSSKTLLFISMLGEKKHFNPEHFHSVCASGLEKDWILNWFGPMAEDAGFTLSSVDICRGDDLPAIDSVDCVILGGTMHVVTEDKLWLKELYAWLPRYRETGKPLLGICGGHQLVSTQFEKGELKGRIDGTLAGTYEIDLTKLGRKHPLFDGLPTKPRFNFANYLHVVPTKAQLLSSLACIGESSAICIDHGGHWYTTQFHPESRKPVWSCMYKHSEPEHVENYSDDQDGAALIRNFINIAALV